MDMFVEDIISVYIHDVSYSIYNVDRFFSPSLASRLYLKTQEQ